jgi:hypothetical protein
MSNRCHIRDIEICQDSPHEIIFSCNSSCVCHIEVRNFSRIANQITQKHGSALVHSFTQNTESEGHHSWR